MANKNPLWNEQIYLKLFYINYKWVTIKKIIKNNKIFKGGKLRRRVNLSFMLFLLIMKLEIDFDISENWDNHIEKMESVKEMLQL